MEPGRRRGDEYRTGQVESPSEGDLELAREEGPSWVAEAVERKRGYAGDLSNLHLLVYVNFPTYELSYADTVSTLATPSNDFASIWLLTGDAICCIKASSALGRLPGWYCSPAQTSEA
jgi:hypothetical protein